MPKLQTDGVRTLAGTSLTGSYQDVGAVTTFPTRIIMVKNTTDAPVTISWDDGTTDVFDIPAGGADTLDVTSNSNDDDRQQDLYLVVGAQFQAKHQGGAATSGKVIIQVFG